MVESIQQQSDKCYAVLWSGGKDSCLAMWQARQSGLRVQGLINFFDATSGRVRFHGVRSALIADQARALGVDLFQYKTDPDTFRGAFEAALREIKMRGYAGVIAGDIHLEEVRKWNEDKAYGVGLSLLEPLWHETGLNIVRSLLKNGFRSVLTCCEDRWSSICWPGREIDSSFVDAVSGAPGLDPCGEHGEYHSFVFDGPMFSHPVHWMPGEIRHGNGFSQIDLIPSTFPIGKCQTEMDS